MSSTIALGSESIHAITRRIFQRVEYGDIEYGIICIPLSEAEAINRGLLLAWNRLVKLEPQDIRCAMNEDFMKTVLAEVGADTGALVDENRDYRVDVFFFPDQEFVSFDEFTKGLLSSLIDELASAWRKVIREEVAAEVNGLTLSKV